MSGMPKMSGMRGFSLIELMVVVVIIGILASIALPSYNRYTFRARRADAQTILQNIATAQERYYSTYNKYTADLTKFGYPATAASEGGHYNVSVALTDVDQGYLATGTPQAVQAADKCGNLTLSSTGVRGKSGDESNGKCW